MFQTALTFRLVTFTGCSSLPSALSSTNPWDPMPPGPFARGNGGPQHRGEHGLQGGQVAVYAFAQKFLERGHLPLRHERFDDLPVGGVPADQQNFGSLGQALRFLALFSSASFSFFRACAFFFTASQSLGNSSRHISTARYPKASTARAPEHQMSEYAPEAIHPVIRSYSFLLPKWSEVFRSKACLGLPQMR